MLKVPPKSAEKSACQAVLYPAQNQKVSEKNQENLTDFYLYKKKHKKKMNNKTIYITINEQI